MLHLDQFINKQKDEKVIFFLRRHPIVFFGTTLFILFLIFIPFILYFMIEGGLPSLLSGPVSRPILLLAVSSYELLMWLFLFTQFVDYYLDVWAITTERILNVEQQGLFSRTVSELDMAKVQDVTSEIKGIIPSIFNYGTVYIQTAGETKRFTFEQVPQPHKVRMSVLELVEKDRPVSV